MNKLSKERRVQILTALCEGMSMRATSRMVGCSINTVTKLLVEAGMAAGAFQDKQLRNLKLRRIQCDEIWSFCYSKAKNVPADKQGEFGVGDVWTWVAMDADTKLVSCWLLGTRDAGCAAEFMQDLSRRLAHRVQLTTDGHKPYLEAVEGAFGPDVDYAMLVKLYGDEPKRTPEARYSPGHVLGVRHQRVSGDPDKRHISTSYIERQNLTMRMSMKRFARLSNGFSKKVENLACALALHYYNYNFCRKHKSLDGKTPAMAAGLTPEPATLGDLVDMLD